MRHLVLIAVLAFPAAAQIFRGKVVMSDASVPPQRVFIERVCMGVGPNLEGVANKHGEYLLRLDIEAFGLTRSMTAYGVRHCVVRARMKGFESNTIDIYDPKVFANPQLPVLILRPADASKPPADAASLLPKTAAKAWDSGAKALAAEQWAAAERLLRDVTRASPQFALAWTGVGLACQNQQRPDDARQAFQRAIAADPAALQPRLLLTRIEIAAQHWSDAARHAQALIQTDTAHRYPETYLDLAIARYQLNELDAAQSALLEALRLDPQHKLPQAEYFLGAVLAGKGDRPAAIAHLRSYLERAPSAPGAELVKQQIEDLSRAAATPQLALRAPEAVLAQAVAEPEVTAAGEASVPGGRQALAAVAHMRNVPGPESFFLEYCRTLAQQTSRLNPDPIAGYATTLQTFLATAAELADLGERREDRTIIRLSLTGAALPKTQRILALLGWKVFLHNGKPTLEPGDQPADGPRQQIPPALGIDELVMQSALESGRDFQFEILSETATLTGGAAWSATLEGFATLGGGIAEAFIRQPRLARAYAGLGAMPPAAALAFARRVGLRTLVATLSDPLWLYGDALRVSGDHAVIPGGPAAEEIWTKLAAASPRDALKFFQALLTVDHGRLAAFYAALAHADPAHQQFFTRNLATAQRYYAWYRDSEELHEGVGVPARAWRAAFFQTVPLDDQGAIRYPGGPAAWNTAADDDESLLAVARLERQSGRPLPPESAQLLAENLTEWHALLPYFDALPGLGPADFQALAAFTSAVAAYPRAHQNLVLGEWHSLVALIVLGRQAGTLDDAAAAHHFAEVCRTLLARDHAAKALAALRAIAGPNPNLDDAVAADLLRLTGSRRAAWDRVRELQHAPGLQSLNAASDPAKVVEALAGAVYGAVLDPHALLLNEDADLLRRHVFLGADRKLSLFQPSSLAASSSSPGSHFAGGFAGFEAVARTLARVGDIAAAMPAAASLASSFAAEPAPGAIFRADARLVEAHTTVTDERGRYVDGLSAADFLIRQGGKSVPIAAFENGAAPISCALLLDTSQSMDAAIPALKSAALKLIAALRPNDHVAVYSLNGGVSLLQPFTTDRSAATRAVLRIELGSRTALYDALIRVNRDLTGRAGRKVVVVFTDGEDNASTLPAATAILRAKTAGVPIYTVAQGHAVRNRILLKDLDAASQATGGLAFSIESAAEIGGVFEKVLQDLLHGYLLAFAPPPAGDHEWRPIQVLLRNPRNAKVRSREGYYPE